MAILEHIYISHSRGGSIKSMKSANAITDCGLEGDRYANGADKDNKDPANQITLIEAEKIEAFVEETGLPLEPYEPRRNLVTRGIDLNALVGKLFRVGEVTLEGMKLCEPCTIWSNDTYKEVLPFFVHKGGLNARIVHGGKISRGDKIETCN